MTQTTEQQAKANLDVIVERLQNIKEDNAQEHAAILEQAKKTNGTVADLVKWKERMLGALIIMNALILPIIISVVIKFVIKDLNF
jgi:hypothetical protein